MSHFFTSEELKNGWELVLTGEQHHHLSRVLRMQPEDPVTLFDGKGSLYNGWILEIEKEKTRIKVQEKVLSYPEPSVSLHLIQALTKGDRFEYLLEKGTEMGFRSFTPLYTGRTVKRIKEKNLNRKMERWRKIVLGAAQQSKRAFLPDVNPPAHLKGLQKMIGVEKDVLWAWEGSSLPLKKIDLSSFSGELYLLIGPEGGFAPEEVNLLKKWDFKDFSLGPKILRSDTAGLVAGTLILDQFAGWEVQ